MDDLVCDLYDRRFFRLQLVLQRSHPFLERCEIGFFFTQKRFFKQLKLDKAPLRGAELGNLTVEDGVFLFELE